MKINLGLHLGFAATRYNYPKIWSELVRKEFNLNYVQFVSDLIDPDLPDEIINKEINRTDLYQYKNFHWINENILEKKFIEN